MSAETEESPAPPPKVRIGRLNTLRGVRRELAKLYADLRHERVLPKVAGTGAFILQAITKNLEVEVFETRVAALEERAGIFPQRLQGRPHAKH